MNFLNVFEERISSLFTATAADASPVSFKKLAKEASKELQNETYVINGVDTAPALFTILINGADNKQMAAIQADLANETALFLEAAGTRKKYKFVGKPLVRFMVDTSLKPGKFSVFAENIDANTLEKLRAEEESFLGGASSREKTYGDEFDAIGQSPVVEQPQKLEEKYGSEMPEPSARPARASRRADAASGPQTRRRRMPASAGREASRGAAAGTSANAAGARAAAGAGMAGAAGVGAAGVGAAAASTDAGRSAAAASQAARPSSSRSRSVSLVNPRAAAQQPTVPPEHTAMLIDRQTGQTFTCTTEECIIGRERTASGIVLPNPNISRQHAKLSFNGRYWAIEDLGSTNGTLVNNVDVQKTRLSAGDVITLGLTNLEFMEG